MLDTIESCCCIIIWATALLGCINNELLFTPILDSVQALLAVTNLSIMWIRYRWLQSAFGQDGRKAGREIMNRMSFAHTFWIGFQVPHNLWILIWYVLGRT